MSLILLPASTVKLITSSQIITSVSSAVKELFENALDAGATSVDVKLVNFGLDRIEVKDNGSGISKENTASMALPHYTSKIKDFGDLDSLETYGFRGEALNALCRVGQVTVTTATSSDDTAVVYTLDSSGTICGTKPAPHVQGTTVVVSNLFKSLPVRRQMMGSSKKAQEELKVIETVVKSFAVIKPNIRVTLYHNKCLIWQKTPCSSLQNSFSQLVGYSTCQQLELLSIKVNDEISVAMLIPKRDCDISALTKSTPAFSLVFVNERPITYKKILKILHQQLVEKFGDNFSPRKFAVCLVSLTLTPSNIDVNLEPNKTKVLFKDEDVILIEIENQLEGYYTSPTVSKPPHLEEASEIHGPQKHSILFDLEDDRENKRRKIDEVPSTTKYLCSQNDVLPHSLEATHVSESTEILQVECGEPELSVTSEATYNGNRAEELDALPPNCANEEKVLSFESSMPSDFVEIGESVPHPEDQSKTSQAEVENICNLNALIPPVQELKSNSLKEPTEEVHNSGTLEHLWDDVNDGDLNELSMCLDAIASSTQSETVNNQPSKRVDLIGSKAWSMGHIENSQGGNVKGSCVFVGSHARRLSSEAEQVPLSKSPEKSSELGPQILTTLVSSESDSKKSPLKSPRLFPSPNSAGTSNWNGSSTGIDSSLQSVSSQMGRRELAAFTKFAREIRPQIVLENPGIVFTDVASMLAEKWQSLSTEEREHYEEIARETANAKKVWKVQDKQKKLEWLKKLPVKEDRKNVCKSSVTSKRPHRKEIPFSINIGLIKTKTTHSSLHKNSKQGENFGVPGNSLVGRLQPSGTWILVENTEIKLLNHCRLQEVVINHRLLATHALTLKPSPLRESLNEVVLGDEAWKTLLCLPCSMDDLRQTKVVAADIIVKNGFKIEMRGDNKSAILTEVADVLNYYGIKELKETLSLGRTWPNIELSECRPLRVINHIKSEAMRICRKSPSMFERIMIEDLLEYWRTAMTPGDALCLHSRAILTPIFNIAEKTQLHTD